MCLLFWEHKHCACTYKQAETHSCTLWELTVNAETVVPDNFPKMHSALVLMLDLGLRLDLYLNHQLPGFFWPLEYTHKLQHKLPKMLEQLGHADTCTNTHTESATVDEKCTCTFPYLREYLTLTQNRKNPEMILPVLPYSLHANWRLMEEMDHIDRLPPSQQRQQQHSTAKRPYLKGNERWMHPLVHFMPFTSEKPQIPSHEGMKESEEKTPCSCSISENHAPVLTALESERDLHQLSAPHSVRNNSSQSQRLLSFTNLAASFVGTRWHTTHQQPQTRSFFNLLKQLSIKEQLSKIHVLVGALKSICEELQGGIWRQCGMTKLGMNPDKICRACSPTLHELFHGRVRWGSQWRRQTKQNLNSAVSVNPI